MTSHIFKLSNYPEYTLRTHIGGKNIQIKEYGEVSNHEQMAMISHYLHNTDLLSEADKEIQHCTHRL